MYNQALESSKTPEYQRRLKKDYSELLIYLVDPIIILLTLFILIDSYNHTTQTMIAHNLGKNIMVRIFMKNINKSSSLTYSQFLSIIIYKKAVNIKKIFNNSVYLNSIIKELTQEESEGLYDDIKNQINEYYIKLGLRFMSLFYTEPVSLFYLDYRIKGVQSSLTDMNKPLKLFLSEEYEIWADDFKKTAAIQPKNIPMLCEPIK